MIKTTPRDKRKRKTAADWKQELSLAVADASHKGFMAGVAANQRNTHMARLQAYTEFANAMGQLLQANANITEAAARALDNFMQNTSGARS